MNIVTTTSVFPPNYPAEQALHRLSRVGFSCLDMAFDYCTDPSHPFVGDEWKAWAYELRKKADALGVRYTHAHARGDAASRGTIVLRTMEACKLLGIKYLVIHPLHKQNGEVITDDAEFIKINAEAIRPLLPYAEENGVTILSENLLWGSSIRPDVIARLVEAVDHLNFSWCFDTGHAHCSGIPVSALRSIRTVPRSLHIQDNSGKPCKDEHLIPGDGTIDWKEFLDLLLEVGYEGDLVLEAHHQSLDAADEDREKILSDLLSRAERMNAYLERTIR